MKNSGCAWRWCHANVKVGRTQMGFWKVKAHVPTVPSGNYAQSNDKVCGYQELMSADLIIGQSGILKWKPRVIKPCADFVNVLNLLREVVWLHSNTSSTQLPVGSVSWLCQHKFILSCCVTDVLQFIGSKLKKGQNVTLWKTNYSPSMSLERSTWPPGRAPSTAVWASPVTLKLRAGMETIKYRSCVVNFLDKNSWEEDIWRS